jgi:hypothetical protein
LFNKKNCSPLQVLFKAKAFQTEKEISFDGEAQDIAIAGSTNIKMSHSEPDWNKIGRGPKIYTDAAWKSIVSPLNTSFFNKERA